jgi:hypothetical protein
VPIVSPECLFYARPCRSRALHFQIDSIVSFRNRDSKNQSFGAINYWGGTGAASAGIFGNRPPFHAPCGCFKTMIGIYKSAILNCILKICASPDRSFISLPSLPSLNDVFFPTAHFLRPITFALGIAIFSTAQILKRCKKLSKTAI